MEENDLNDTFVTPSDINEENVKVTSMTPVAMFQSIPMDFKQASG